MKTLYHLRIYLLLVVVTAACFTGHAGTKQPSDDILLDQLDGLLRQVESLENQRQDRINALKESTRETNDREKLYWITRDIFDQYSIFDSDSALAYGRRALKLATDLNRSDWQGEVRVMLSYTLAAIGLLDESREMLNAVDPEQLTPDRRIDYMGQQLYLLTHQAQYVNASRDAATLGTTSQQLLDSIATIISPEHPDYPYYIAYRALGSPDNAREAIPLVEPYLTSLGCDSRRDAKLAWVVSQLYLTAGDKANHLKYLTLSAITDLRIANREIASLEEISGIMDDRGDLQRALSYINHCQRCAELYKNRVRALRITSLQRDISAKYQDRLIKLQRTTERYLLVVLILVAVLIGTIAFIMVQRKRLAASNRRLQEANADTRENLGELKDAYSKIAAKNEELLDMSTGLMESNRRHESDKSMILNLMGNAITDASLRIRNQENLRRQIARLLNTGQIDAARRIADSPEAIQEEIKNFLTTFDSIMLSVYPDFVKDFNTLLRPGEEVTPRGEGLNTDLRIYALIYLGITDSVSIAKVLHCSVQTVYNKRQMMRGRAAVPKESFAESVRSLGKNLPI